jgi:hypothetical protein
MVQIHLELRTFSAKWSATLHSFAHFHKLDSGGNDEFCRLIHMLEGAILTLKTA